MGRSVYRLVPRAEAAVTRPVARPLQTRTRCYSRRPARPMLELPLSHHAGQRLQLLQSTIAVVYRVRSNRMLE